MTKEIIAETSRLILRKFIPDDDEAFYHLNADQEVIRYTGDPPFASVEAAREFIEGYQAYDNYGFGRWVVEDKNEQRFVGFCGLSRNEQNDVDLGFRFFRADWGKGYATESALMSLKVGFEDLHLPYLVGRAATANGASIRVLEKIGMTFWKYDGCKGIADAVYYRMDAQDYFSSKR